jgi:hypothetical protein
MNAMLRRKGNYSKRTREPGVEQISIRLTKTERAQLAEMVRRAEKRMGLSSGKLRTSSYARSVLLEHFVRMSMGEGEGSFDE